MSKKGQWLFEWTVITNGTENRKVVDKYRREDDTYMVKYVRGNVGKDYGVNEYTLTAFEFRNLKNQKGWEVVESTDADLEKDLRIMENAPTWSSYVTHDKDWGVRYTPVDSLRFTNRKIFVLLLTLIVVVFVVVVYWDIITALIK